MESFSSIVVCIEYGRLGKDQWIQNLFFSVRQFKESNPLPSTGRNLLRTLANFIHRLFWPSSTTGFDRDDCNFHADRLRGQYVAHQRKTRGRPAVAYAASPGER